MRPESAATLVTVLTHTDQTARSAWFKGYVTKVNDQSDAYKVADLLKLAPGSYEITVTCQPSSGSTFKQTQTYLIEASKTYVAK